MKRMRLAEAAERAGISKKVLRRACLETKTLNFMRGGDGPTSPILIEEADLNDWLKRHTNLRVLSPAEFAACAREAKGEA